MNYLLNTCIKEKSTTNCHLMILTFRIISVKQFMKSNCPQRNIPSFVKIKQHQTNSLMNYQGRRRKKMKPHDAVNFSLTFSHFFENLWGIMTSPASTEANTKTKRHWGPQMKRECSLWQKDKHSYHYTHAHHKPHIYVRSFEFGDSEGRSNVMLPFCYHSHWQKLSCSSLEI